MIFLLKADWFIFKHGFSIIAIARFIYPMQLKIVLLNIHV
ncbi:MAG: hypothetical protein JWR61_678 [Ferruginibacter sp.]|nr:hypothetical protein [Ferruginibacter sp.]